MHNLYTNGKICNTQYDFCEWPANNAENLLNSVNQKKSQMSSKKHGHFANKWVITLKIIYKTKFGIETASRFSEIAVFVRGRFRRSLYSKQWGLSMTQSQITTVFLLAKSLHFLACIITAVHPWFTLSVRISPVRPFAITKPPRKGTSLKTGPARPGHVNITPVITAVNFGQLYNTDTSLFFNNHMWQTRPVATILYAFLLI